MRLTKKGYASGAKPRRMALFLSLFNKTLTDGTKKMKLTYTAYFWHVTSCRMTFFTFGDESHSPDYDEENEETPAEVAAQELQVAQTIADEPVILAGLVCHELHPILTHLVMRL